jgi:hypothetical protein
MTVHRDRFLCQNSQKIHIYIKTPRKSCTRQQRQYGTTRYAETFICKEHFQFSFHQLFYHSTLFEIASWYVSCKWIIEQIIDNGIHITFRPQEWVLKQEAAVRVQMCSVLVGLSGVASTNRPNILRLAADHCFPHHKTQRNTAGWEGKYRLLE